MPKYAPLWFAAMRLLQRRGPAGTLALRALAGNSLAHLSRELQWKSLLEAAQVQAFYTAPCPLVRGEGRGVSD